MLLAVEIISITTNNKKTPHTVMVMRLKAVNKLINPIKLQGGFRTV